MLRSDMFHMLLVVAFAGGCAPKPDTGAGADSGSDTKDSHSDPPTGDEVIDSDGDGVAAADDCDDLDAGLGAVADDADCDGALTPDDCDDNDPSVYPGAPEVWGDGIDQDCDGIADAEGSSCSADFIVSFPDGSATTIDGCADWAFDASLEYDPDDPPEVVEFTVLLGATEKVGFECQVEVVQLGVCGPGYYDQRGDTTTTRLTLMDCGGVADEYEAVFTASQGYLRVDSLDAGDEAGSFAGAPLVTTLEAHLHAWTDEGIDIEGDILLSRTQLAGDGEEQTECAVTDGDSDGDGFRGPNFDGDDCIDDNERAFPYDVDGDGDADGCGWKRLSAGPYHNCLIDSMDTLLCWGDSVASDAPSGTFVEVDAGRGHNCALDALGGITCWGSDEFGEVSATPAGAFVMVTAGEDHTCALDAAGGIECWGRDDYGQVSDTPVGEFAVVDAGPSHSCAMDLGGAVQCWGFDEYGQVSDTPSGVFSALSVGDGHHNCVLDALGGVTCWGRDEYGQSSDVPSAGPFRAVSAGGAHTCAEDSSGSVVCWGYDVYGQVLDAPAGPVALVRAGASHNCAVDLSGDIGCWGFDNSGQVSEAP